MGFTGQRIRKTGAGDVSHQGKSDFLARVKDGPFRPGRISRIAQPGAEIRVSHYQWEDGRRKHGSGSLSRHRQQDWQKKLHGSRYFKNELELLL